jgi:hypothetical protein
LRGQGTSKGEKPKQFQGSGFEPNGNFVKKGGSFQKGANPREMLMGKPKEATKVVSLHKCIKHVLEEFSDVMPEGLSDF